MMTSYSMTKRGDGVHDRGRTIIEGENYIKGGARNARASKSNNKFF